jgi:hypothetical protein
LSANVAPLPWQLKPLTQWQQPPNIKLRQSTAIATNMMMMMMSYCIHFTPAKTLGPMDSSINEAMVSILQLTCNEGVCPKLDDVALRATSSSSCYQSSHSIKGNMNDVDNASCLLLRFLHKLTLV